MLLIYKYGNKPFQHKDLMIPAWKEAKTIAAFLIKEERIDRDMLSYHRQCMRMKDGNPKAPYMSRILYREWVNYVQLVADDENEDPMRVETNAQGRVYELDDFSELEESSSRNLPPSKEKT